MTGGGRIWVVIAVAVVVGLAADWAFDTRPAALPMTTGFFGCILLILGSKNVVAKVLQRPESYYADLAERTTGPTGEATDDG